MITTKAIEKKTMTEAKRKEAKNSFFAFYIGRPITYYLTIPFLYTNISPNTVTIISIIFTILGFGFVSFGQTVGTRLIGVLFFFLWSMFDGVDGNIARYKNIKSDNGDLLDTLGGYLSMTLILLSIGNATVVDDRSLRIITPLFPIVLSEVSAVSTIIPRLLMHRKNAMKGNSASNALKDKSSYSIPKIIMLNICDPAGFQQVFMLLAILFGLCTEFSIAYFLINVLVMVYSIRALLD